MPKGTVKFVGDLSDGQPRKWGGMTFTEDEPEGETQNEDILRKAVTNPYFEVSGWTPSKGTKRTEVTEEDPNAGVDLKNQASLDDLTGNEGGVGTVEPMVVEQPLELLAGRPYPDTRNKAPTGGSGVATVVAFEEGSFEDTPSVEGMGNAGDDSQPRRRGRPRKAKAEE